MSQPLKRRLSTAVFLLLVLTAARAQCDLVGEPIRLEVGGLGVAYFQDFETKGGGDRVELSGGVCIEGVEGGWTVVAERATLSGLQSDEGLRAEISHPLVRYQGWQILAVSMSADGTELRMRDVTFSGHEVMGSASLLQLNLLDGRTVAESVRVRGEGFRVEAESAEFVGDAVDMRLVLITTCTCPGRPFYVLGGSSARLSLADQRLDVRDGYMDLGGLRLPLSKNLRLTEAVLEELALPVTLEYTTGQTGTGLSLIVPNLELEQGLSLELGLLGLDDDHPLQALALARYRAGNASFTVGRARGGPRADFRIAEPVAPSLEASFAIHNRHDEGSDYLHEGLLEVKAEPPSLRLGENSALHLSGRAFAAVSSQELESGQVVSPRLGAVARAQASLPTGPGAVLSLSLEGRFTEYPAVEASQYGVSLGSGWRYRNGPWALDVRHDRMWTDSGSPFSDKLDRLTPRNELAVRSVVAGPVSGELEGSLQFDLAYDLLLLGGDAPDGLQRLGLTVGFEHPVGPWQLSLRNDLEFAGLLDPDPALRRAAHVQAAATLQRGEWEIGTRVRYDLRPAREGLSLLEASFAMPLEFESGTLTPFLAVDFAPTVLGATAPSLSGHGLNLTWQSCCGIIKVGYRQHGGDLATSFGLGLEH